MFFTLLPVGSHFVYRSLAALASNLAYGSPLSPRYPLKPFTIGPPVAGWQVIACAQAMSASWLRSIAIEKARRPSSPGSLPLFPVSPVLVGSPGLAPGLAANGPVTKLNPTAAVRAPGGMGRRLHFGGWALVRGTASPPA